MADCGNSLYTETERREALVAPTGVHCMGPGGTGHFVKMVHNGMEYGDMQLIGEAYHVMRAVGSGLAVPAMAAALAYHDGLHTAVSPANLLQAQRDYFGAHTYERLDRPEGQTFHTSWPDVID